MSTVPTAVRPAALRSNFALFLFWVPLAAQWLMMALEGPFLAAIIARTADPAFNLAAYGVAFAFAILVESPVIMLMSAATALVEDAVSYRRLRNFANVLNVASTALLLFILIPGVHAFIMGSLLGLPAEVTGLVYGALWLLLPWPAAIGYRRFLHGVLIRSGRTRLVAYGTILRLGGMAATALLLFTATGLPGAWVGAAALSAGVCVEALATRFMARAAIHDLLGGGRLRPFGRHGAQPGAPETGSAARALASAQQAASQDADARRARASARAGYTDIARFYYPLALTSFISLTVQPILTFFMGRSPAPVESLAVFPVVHALSFVFRSVGFSYQEVVIALVGERFEHVRMLFRFGVGLMIVASGSLALVAFTPLADFWFVTISGLTPELAAFAITPTRVAVLFPALAVLLALQHGLLVRGRRTRPITLATGTEVLSIAVFFALLGWGLGLVGVTAALLALVSGRAVGNLVLVGWVRRLLRRPQS
jgi:progressive ankylosis protein